MSDEAGNVTPVNVFAQKLDARQAQATGSSLESTTLSPEESAHATLLEELIKRADVFAKLEKSGFLSGDPVEDLIQLLNFNVRHKIKYSVESDEPSAIAFETSIPHGDNIIPFAKVNRLDIVSSQIRVFILPNNRIILVGIPEAIHRQPEGIIVKMYQQGEDFGWQEMTIPSPISQRRKGIFPLDNFLIGLQEAGIIPLEQKIFHLDPKDPDELDDDEY